MEPTAYPRLLESLLTVSISTKQKPILLIFYFTKNYENIKAMIKYFRRMI